MVTSRTIGVGPDTLVDLMFYGGKLVEVIPEKVIRDQDAEGFREKFLVALQSLSREVAPTYGAVILDRVKDL
jgi:hypothetical protein